VLSPNDGENPATTELQVSMDLHHARPDLVSTDLAYRRGLFILEARSEAGRRQLQRLA
jgi:hypothetical protein